MAQPSHPVLLYDGRCGFCMRHVQRWRALTGESVEYRPYQSAGSEFEPLTVDQMSRAVHLVLPDGQVLRGAEAVFRLFTIGRRRPEAEWLYQGFPPFRWLADFGYAWIAAHRDLVDPLDRRLFGNQTEPISYRLTRSTYLRALGLIYLFAFVSLWVQILGLVGSHGILPVHDLLNYVRQQFDSPQRFLFYPTLCWLNSSDAFLQFLCAGGAAMAVLLIIGVMPTLMLIGLWVFYLSLTIAGQTFLEFQWDILLLEAGFASILLSPAQWWMNWRKAAEPSRIGIWLIRWLAFRIMFLSGMTKLLSGDPSWRNGRALTFHWWTQPLPPWTAWYLSHAPLWFDIVSCCVMFFAELIAPWFIFTPRKLRRMAFWSIVLFQVLILVTGNYGFFNLLTIVICIPLLDDFAWPKRWRRNAMPIRFATPWRTVAFAPVACGLIILTCVAFAGECDVTVNWPRWVAQLYARAEPFRSANGYGLFRVMTTERPEIIIEGSDDGQNWKPYEFKFKPGDLARRPIFCTPHMPRLDWQMWFEALGGEPDEWFRNFLVRLLQGSPPVLDLMKVNPFPDHPPRYLRATLYEYHFSKTHADGRWWQRDELSPFMPVVQLRNKTDSE